MLLALANTAVQVTTAVVAVIVIFVLVPPAQHTPPEVTVMAEEPRVNVLVPLFTVKEFIDIARLAESNVPLVREKAPVVVLRDSASPSR